MTDASKLAYAIAFLRRTMNLGQITTLANAVGAAVVAGKSKITVTRSGFEGGSSEAVVEFEVAITGQACEKLLADAAAQAITDPAASIAAIKRIISNTVIFGPRIFGPTTL